MLNFPKKFTGSCWWSYEPVQIKRAIYRKEKEIVIEFESEDYIYLVTLLSQDGRIFEGEFSATKGNEHEKGKVTGRVYWDEAGPLLIGSWQEGGNGTWFVRLHEVEHFDDENID
ncbi:hypothetical protein [Candidatus Venteria ishoeyi]|uniref:Uncharacterized protein n=1 Tax=Candidatus Venteria ishoeyi TaxID=1899563 RepID=A0A1H6F627_9GAMM|nr:hypothetical protein [Candidatus Venteria ishoeyi]MDM8547740.1 hypothetical protein [Candidatus Venteria ishoeyi]SEH04841.1 Uncharacterised protein [Candidatus Venteria ishoeyi]